MTLRAARRLGVEDTFRRCASGEDALTILRAGTGIPSEVGLVLLDLNLPGISGHELLGEIRADPDLAWLPVVVLTTSSRPEDVELSYRCGASAYLVKPTGLEEHAAVVASLVSFWITNVTLPVVRALTGLFNRARFISEMEGALARSLRSGRAGGLIYLDIDGLKQINDSLGHVAGDTLLATVADRLTDGLRDADSAARIGGDEFTVLLEDAAGEESFHATATRLLELVSEPLTLGGRSVTPSISMGVVRFPEDGNTADQLIHNADSAMYLAKRSGGNQVCKYAPDSPAPNSVN